MPQLDFSTYSAQIFWLAIIFSVLYFFIARFVAPKIDSLMTAREETRSNDLSRADEAEKKASEAEKAWQKALVEARAKASENLTSAGLSIKEMEAKQSERLGNVIKAKERDTEVQIQLLKSETAKEFPHIVSEVARSIISKIANKNLSDADVSAQVAQSIKG